MKIKNVILLALLALCLGFASCKSGGFGRKDKCPGMNM